MQSLRTTLFQYGTPLTVGLFAVSAISGAALFFHWLPGVFHSMHEILSMVLLLPFAVHVWKNWKPLVGYFRKAAMPLSLGLSLVAAGAFAYAAAGNGRSGNPAMALVAAAQTAPISVVAPVLKLDAEAALKRLSDAGIGTFKPEDTIAAIAKSSGRDPFEIIARLTQPAAN